MQKYLFKNISVVNEGHTTITDVFISRGRIEKIGNSINVIENVVEIQGEGLHLLPGIIDDQVHFREPGLTDKATIHSESKAGVAGGVTSFMEMPNTIPNALTQELLENKYAIAARSSLSNYSFYMGVSNTNSDEVLRSNDKKKNICGIKIFLGSSTGNMLVNKTETLHRIFSESELLIATHCEDEHLISSNYKLLKENKQLLEPADHPVIRTAEACYSSSASAIALAKKYGSRLHVLHITSGMEVALFDNKTPLSKKDITAEVCVHHLHFTSEDYDKLAYLIKCNPAIKSTQDKQALWHALLNDSFDVIATDHAPHTLAEKQPPYEHAHAGLPLIQHGLLLMLKYYNEGIISLERIVEKMSHAVADCFKLEDRGYIREGYFADLVVLDLKQRTEVTEQSLLYKCGWSPLTGETLPGKITDCFINGNRVYSNDNYGNIIWNESSRGERLKFNR